jgi:sortase A
MGNKRKIISITLIAAGCLLLMYPLFTQWKVDQSQQHAEQEWKKLNKVYATTDGIEADNKANQPVDNNTKGSQYSEKTDVTKESTNHDSTSLDYRQEVEKHQVLGQLSIPKIDLEVMVVPGVEEEDIKHAIGWMTTTGFPGEAGNVVFAGHRSHTYGKFFHRLDEMEIGDQLSLDTHFGSFNYRVREIKVVEPTDLSVLKQTDHSLLTLITCEPLYSNDYRLIVIAEELEHTGRSVSYR